MSVPNIPIVNAGLLYVNNLQLAYQGGANSLLNIQPGLCRDVTNTNDIVLPQAVNPNGSLAVDQYGNPVGALINGAFVGPNGVDLVPIVGTMFYAVYLIGDSTGYKSPAGLLSINQIEPYLPEGYDMYRRIGYCFTSTVSSVPVINHWYQYGSGETRNYWYDKLTESSAVINIPASPAPTWTSFPVFSVPYLADQVFMDIAYKPAVAGNLLQFLPYGSPAAAASPSGAQGCVRLSGVVAGDYQTINMVLPVEIADSGTPPAPYATLLYLGDASDAFALNATGFVDFLA